METINTPEAAPTKEYYHYGFQELCREVGEEKALAEVRKYQDMTAKLVDSCPTYVLHTCRLLLTHADPSLELEPVVNPTPMDKLCSVFYAPITNTTNQKQLTIWQVADLIRSRKFKKQTDELRTLTDKKANRTYKATAFCYATFSGTFSRRADANLIEHSGLICIDLDNLYHRLDEIRAIVNADPWTVMSFTSPNGDGLKVLYELDESLLHQPNYQELTYKAFSNHLRRLCRLEDANIDRSCKDVSRACFLPYDANLYINPHFVKA